MPIYQLPGGPLFDDSGTGGLVLLVPGFGLLITSGGGSTSEDLTGVRTGVTLGAVSPEIHVALTGIRLGVQQGGLSPGSEGDVSGVAMGISLGTLLPRVEVPLRGLRIGVRLGAVRVPAEFYTLGWTMPIWLTGTLNSYLYYQYQDDDDMQAFVAAYNTLSQGYVDWFTTIDLPIYTGAQIAGALLDWVALGLYGQARPTLPSGYNLNLGPLNTFAANVMPPNGQTTIASTDFYATTDDVFKRILTWNFFKGDGRQFSVTWLKRRVMRFLLGSNGTDPGVDQTYQVSVGFGVGNAVDIRILSGLRAVTGGTIPGAFACNVMECNRINTVFTQYVPLEFAPVFKAAVDAGALQLPFQFDWTVTV